MILPSLKPQHLKRYKDILRLMRYLRSDLIQDPELALLEDDEATGAAPPEAEKLASELEALGPTLIKRGRLLSTRADLLPLPYLTALSRLQDKIEPFPFEEVEH